MRQLITALPLKADVFQMSVSEFVAVPKVAVRFPRTAMNCKAPIEVGVAALRHLGLTHPADLARLGVDEATARRVLWPNHDVDTPPSLRRRSWRCLACSKIIEHRDTDCPVCGGDTFEEVALQGGGA
jgi:hypothetical protein